MAHCHLPSYVDNYICMYTLSLGESDSATVSGRYEIGQKK